MVSLKQELDVLDYFGPFIVFLAFLAIVFIISVTCILGFCVTDTDDKTVFHKMKTNRAEKTRAYAENETN